MWKTYITSVDVFERLLPGAVACIGILAIPGVVTDIENLTQISSFMNKSFLGALSVIGIVFAVVSYILGFLSRLGSMKTIEYLTLRLHDAGGLGRKLVPVHWGKKLQRCAVPLENELSLLLGQELFKALNYIADEESEECATHDMKPDIRHYYARCFGFISRLTRIMGSAECAEREHWEKEILFMTGLFLPLLFWVVVSIILLFKCYFAIGSTALSISILGLMMILRHFPDARVREVRNTYYLAIAAIKVKELNSGKCIDIQDSKRHDQHR